MNPYMIDIHFCCIFLFQCSIETGASSLKMYMNQHQSSATCKTLGATFLGEKLQCGILYHVYLVDPRGVYELIHHFNVKRVAIEFGKSKNPTKLQHI